MGHLIDSDRVAVEGVVDSTAVIVSRFMSCERGTGTRAAAIGVFDPADVWIFDANGTPLTTRKIAGGGVDQIFDRQQRISGDGLRMITITGDQFSNPISGVKLNFATVGP